ncbi:MBL fold metallo-hydrolase [Candidatus Binatus sp.]|uniref:MBL fold metallo-hydrolase n=1 Tax=Candidatus Binatus sp. TaxID=2811406 RepID=UPI002F9335FC
MASRIPLEKPPDADELEVSLFGPGIGECAVLHLGSGEWIIVDSCVDTGTHEPVALEYLRKLDVDVGKSIKLLVITHWHNDHMLGASKILAAADSCEIACSAALGSHEFAELVAASTQERFGEMELPEFARIVDILRARRSGARRASVGPEYAIEGKVLYRREASHDRVPVLVHALSPSSGSLTLSHLQFARFLPRYKESRLTPVALPPNDLAVALWVAAGDRRILLGSDLEESANPNVGWRAVVASKTRPPERAFIFKVPHHGSETSHNENVWDQMLELNSVAVLTPFLRGVKPLPSKDDAKRLQARTSQVFVTALPGGWKPLNRQPAVERMLGRKLRAMTGKMGHIRIRCSTRSAEAPTVDLFSGAMRLPVQAA